MSVTQAENMQFISEQQKIICLLFTQSFISKKNKQQKTKQNKTKENKSKKELKCKYDKTCHQFCHTSVSSVDFSRGQFVWVLMYQCREQHTDVFTLTNKQKYTGTEI